MMRATVYESIADFLQQGSQFLRDDRVFNMHQLRIANQSTHEEAQGKPHGERSARWGVLLRDKTEIVAAGLFTQRNALFVSPHAAEHANALISAIPRGANITDVVGHAQAAWAIANGLGGYSMFIKGSLYAIETPARAVSSPARIERATVAHEALLMEWQAAFIQELHLLEPLEQVPTAIKRRLEMGLTFIAYVDDQPVGYASGLLASEGIASVGPVYTVPEFRSRGLAIGQATTASTVNALRATGARTVVLMADQTNPVSNAAYQKIGFVNRGEFHHLRRADLSKRGER